MIDLKHLAEAQAVLDENNFQTFPTPWIGETAKRAHVSGPWADYSAWENWMDNECTQDCVDQRDGKDCERCIHCATWKLWNESESHVRSMLYAIMNGACRDVAVAMGWKDTVPSATEEKVK